jgi:parallel beta-helix repeat protein
VAISAERPTTLVNDRFDRTVGIGWGTAPSGGSYSATAPLTGLSVQGTGSVVLSGERTGRSVWLPSVSTLDATVRADVAFLAAPAGYGQIAAVTLRKVARQQEYRARLRYAGDRSLRLSFSKIVAGRPEQAIGTEVVVATSVAPGVPLALAAGVAGDSSPTLVASAWAAGLAVPAGWQLKYTDQIDPVRSAGGLGTWFYAGGGQTAGARFTVLALSATDQLGTAPAGPLPTAVPTTPGAAPSSAPSSAPSAGPIATGTPSPSATVTTVPVDPALGMSGTRPAAAAGAPPLGSTRYPVPAGAVMVTPTGSDSAAGTAAAPVRTIGQAVRVAASGATIVVRAGVYHEFVQVPSTKRVTIQNWPGEAVWLDGSTVVSGWVQDGSAWRHDGWTAQFDSAVPPASSADFDMIDPRYPMASHPEELWIGGQELRQVGARSTVAAGTFYVDPATDRLYVGSSPAGQEVRATDLAEAIYLNRSAGSVVRGIGIRRYATPVLRYGTVKAFGDNQVLADLHVDSIATVGIGVNGSNVRIQNTTVQDSGQLGIQAHHSDGLSITGTVVRNNNNEHFAEIPAAGGIKITVSRGITVSRNLVTGNGSTGIWMDMSVWDARILSNDVLGNSRHGIYFELSATALIADNAVVDNGGSGIRVADSAHARIWNNTVLRNGMAVDVQDGSRTSLNTTFGRDTRRPQPDPEMTFIVQDVQVRNNVLDVGTRIGVPALLRVDDGATPRTAEQMGVTADSDVYLRPSALQLGTLALWSNRPAGVRSFGTVAAFQSTTRQEMHGLGLDGATGTVLVGDAAAGDLGLRPGSPAAGIGAALPADVLGALGRSAGGAVDPGAFFG